MPVIAIATVDNLRDAAAEFLALTGKARVFPVFGEMGAGKTTFIKTLCELLGTQDTVNSPTFPIINEYRLKNGEPVYHCDFYRIKSLEEAMDTGFVEYLDGKYYCFIEWPEIIENLLPDFAVPVLIKELPDGSRQVSIPASYKLQE